MSITSQFIITLDIQCVVYTTHCIYNRSKFV